MRLRGLIALAAVFVCANFYAQMPAQLTAAAFAATVDAHYNHLASLRTAFTERFSGFNRERVESGTLTMKKPGRMRWDYSSPTGKTFVMDGQNAWSYSPGDAQAYRIPAKQLDDFRSPMRYFLGHANLQKELATLTIKLIAGGYSLSGAPKGMQDTVRLITIEATPAGAMTALRIDQADGTTTEFHFSNMQENPTLKNSDFLFTPPAGIPVTDAMPPI